MEKKILLLHMKDIIGLIMPVSIWLMVTDMGSCPGLLESNNEPPYNNIVSGIYEQPSYTVFDRKKKEIYIKETMGCCSYYETWAKHFEGDNYGNEAKVKITKEVHHDWWVDGKEHVEIYKLINDSLKMVEKKVVE